MPGSTKETAGEVLVRLREADRADANEHQLAEVCVLLVETELKGWQKILNKLFLGTEGLGFSIDAPQWWKYGEVINPMMFTKKLMYLHGDVDPVGFIKMLFKARFYAMPYRIDYGYKGNPEGTQEPNNNNFMSFNFEIDILEVSWYKKIIGVLKTIQGVSFTIDAPSQMVYMHGNIDKGLLMKMLTKTGIQILGMDYNLKPPPKKAEAASDGTEKQPTKDKESTPPSELVVSTSTKQQAKNKKPRGFRIFCCP
ncbi:unnamed protein product [Eruca vesicaria subsp. sativa]|uniref:Uncharacterized protein n=1 Tax=Eruca vesicaria subsp. sativa TaxID=29727 RepID=A0ABC8KAB7_ERUVS|nr:unnamed protein product [Eruca vesicaria subsp. sativa]